MSKLNNQCIVEAIRALVNQTEENSCCITSAVLPAGCYMVAGEFKKLVPVVFTNHATEETTGVYFSLDGKEEYSEAVVVSSQYCPTNENQYYEPFTGPFGYNGSLTQHVQAYGPEPIGMRAEMPNNNLGVIFDEQVDRVALDDGGKQSWYQPLIDAINATGKWAISIIQDADSTTGDQILARVVYVGDEVVSGDDLIIIDLNTFNDGAPDRSRFSMDINGLTNTITITPLPGA